VLRRRRIRFDTILQLFLYWNVSVVADGTKVDMYSFLKIQLNENLSRCVIERTRDEQSRERCLQLLKVLGQGSFGKVFLVRPLCLPVLDVPDTELSMSGVSMGSSSAMSIHTRSTHGSPSTTSISSDGGTVQIMVKKIDLGFEKTYAMKVPYTPYPQPFSYPNHKRNPNPYPYPNSFPRNAPPPKNKVLQKSEVTQRKQIGHTLDERDITSMCRHPYIVPLRYAFQTSDKLYMISDFCTGGELFFHLKKMRRFTEDMVAFYLAQLALAIEYLHSKNVIFRDLKPENILLDARGNCKLTDFGLAKLMRTPQDRPTTFCGTPEYLAPEMVLHRKTAKGYDVGVDWWSLGVVGYDDTLPSFRLFSPNTNLNLNPNANPHPIPHLNSNLNPNRYEMLTGWPPFFDRNFEQLCEKILSRALRFPAKYEISEPCKVSIVVALTLLLTLTLTLTLTLM